MDYILKSRGKGKTYDLILKSNKTRARIVCANRNMARYINEKANHMGLIIPKAVCYDYLFDNKYDHTNEKILIDELYTVLKHVFNTDILAISDTPDSIVVDTKDVSDKTECHKYYM